METHVIITFLPTVLMQLFEVLTAATKVAHEIAVNSLRSVVWFQFVLNTDKIAYSISQPFSSLYPQCYHTYSLQMSRGRTGTLPALFC